MPSTFESKTCGRCHGSGTYSYCTMYGDTCFECRGSKIVLTSRGAKAAQFYHDSLCKVAAEIQAGDVVMLDMSKRKFDAVIEASSEMAEYTSLENGVRVRKEYMRYTIRTATTGTIITDGAQLIRVAHTAEQKAEKIARALAYQNTFPLDKAGRARKHSAKAKGDAILFDVMRNGTTP